MIPIIDVLGKTATVGNNLPTKLDAFKRWRRRTVSCLMSLQWYHHYQQLVQNSILVQMMNNSVFGKKTLKPIKFNRFLSKCGRHNECISCQQIQNWFADVKHCVACRMHWLLGTKNQAKSIFQSWMGRFRWNCRRAATTTKTVFSIWNSP